MIKKNMNGMTDNTSKAPESVQIGPYRFNIVFMDDPGLILEERDDEKKVSGCVKFDEQNIYIANFQGADVLADTILHEILHVIWAVVGGWAFEVDEERIVSMIATTLLDTLRRNPELSKFLLKN